MALSKVATYGLALLACAGLAAFVAAQAHREAQRDRLRVIVQQECVPHWLKTHTPAPCSSVSLPPHEPGAQGFAVLHDRKGGAHFLLIPTRTIRGIESPEVRSSGALNYFEAAWQARDALASVLGHAVPRDAVGMAINQEHARSQDQLHIHLSCLRPTVHEALQEAAANIGKSWSAFDLEGGHYEVMRVMGDELGAANPFELLADRLPGAHDAMGDFTLLVAGMQFPEGPGFVLLAGNSVPGAELMLDPHCAVAG
jgi:CDP-diacylglycerol pyrophosphatase